MQVLGLSDEGRFDAAGDAGEGGEDIGGEPEAAGDRDPLMDGVGGRGEEPVQLGERHGAMDLALGVPESEAGGGGCGHRGWQHLLRGPAPLGFGHDALGEGVLEDLREEVGAELERFTICETLQRVCEVGAGGKALIGRLGEGTEEDVSECDGDIAEPGELLGDAHVADLEHDIEVAGSLEEAAHGEEFEEDDAGREEVGAEVDLLSCDLLGAHVAHLPLVGSALGEVALEARLGDAEVGDLHEALVGEEDVGGGDVAMDDGERLTDGAGGVVGKVEAAEDLNGDVDGDGDRDAELGAGAGCEEVEEVFAGDILHGDEVLPLDLSEVVDLDHVGVVEPDGDTGLVDEHADEVGVFCERGEDDLDGALFGEAVGALKHAAEDVGHAASTDAIDEDELTEATGEFREQGHGFRHGGVLRRAGWQDAGG